MATPLNSNLPMTLAYIGCNYYFVKPTTNSSMQQFKEYVTNLISSFPLQNATCLIFIGAALEKSNFLC